MIIVMVIMSMFFSIPVSAQNAAIVAQGSITVVSGDYSFGSIILTNAGNLAYDLVTLQDSKIVDENGNEISGFSLSFDRTNFIGWKAGKSYTLGYKITAGRNTPPGDYSLVLRFRALTSGGGRLYLLKVKIPIKVLKTPLQFGILSFYNKARPGANQVFNGDILVVYSHIKNIGHFNISAEATTYLERNKIRYLSTSKHVTLTPGDNIVKFEIHIPTDFPEGTYTFIYSIKYPGGEKQFKKSIHIGVGVNIINTSIKSSELFLNEANTAYITLIADRDIPLRILTTASSKKGMISKTEKTVKIPEGTHILQIELPTNVSGDVKANILIYYGTKLLKNSSIEYHVVSYPILSNITYRKISEDMVEINLRITNKNDELIHSILEYELYTSERVLYKKSLNITLHPGSLMLKLNFKVPPGKKIYYRFSLSAFNKNTVREGSIILPMPSTPTSSSSTSSKLQTTSQSPSNTSIPITRTNQQDNKKLYVLVILVIVGVIIIGYHENMENKLKRAKLKPKPKKKSPLGRFKRPKIPRFKESKELPKK